MIFILFITLTIILIGCFVIFNRDFCAPAFLLTIGFWLSSLWAWMYQDNWNGFTNNKLYTLVVGCVASFFIACTIVHMIDRVMYPVYTKDEKKPIEIKYYKLQMYAVFELFIFAATMYVILKNVYTLNIFDAIGQYYKANKYNNLVYDPGFVKILQYINIAGVYIIGYVTINNIICKAKNYSINYVIIVFGMLMTLLQGTRNTMFMFIISGLLMVYLIKGMYSGWKSNLTFKTFIKMLFIIVLLVVLFKVSIHLTGRSSDEYTFTELFSTYVGSPLKNLELFLSEKHEPSTVFGGQTFLLTYRKLFRSTGNEKYNVTSCYQYRWIGRTGLGNVYTLFMPLYQDFGMAGSYCMMAILGVVTQYQYNCVKRKKEMGVINKRIVIYSYTSFAVSFSFFSNKYFEMVVSVAFVYTLIAIYALLFWLFRIFIKDGKAHIYLRHSSEEVAK